METNYNNILVGSETDRLIAEKVMGWTWDKYQRVYRYNPNDNSLFGNGWGDDESPNGYFEPSIDIKAAWEVVEKMRDMGIYLIMMNDGNNGRWSVTAYTTKKGTWDESGSSDERIVEVDYTDTAPLAICRAALSVMKYLQTGG